MTEDRELLKGIRAGVLGPYCPLMVTKVLGHPLFPRIVDPRPLPQPHQDMTEKEPNQSPPGYAEAEGLVVGTPRQRPLSEALNWGLEQ